MVRLPTRGATFAAPKRSLSELEDEIGRLSPSVPIPRDEIKDIHSALGSLIGTWSAEVSRLDASDIAGKLARLSANLSSATELLSAHEGGLSRADDIEGLSHLLDLLSANPEIGSRSNAEQLVASFTQGAAKIAHSAGAAAHELHQLAGTPGRPAMDWYVDFTRLLLAIAERGGIQPRFSKDRISGIRRGWLFEAAGVLETFLDKRMLSPDEEARGKRLERASRIIRLQSGKKPPR